MELGARPTLPEKFENDRARCKRDTRRVALAKDPEARGFRRNPPLSALAVFVRGGAATGVDSPELGLAAARNLETTTGVLALARSGALVREARVGNGASGRRTRSRENTQP